MRQLIFSLLFLALSVIPHGASAQSTVLNDIIQQSCSNASQELTFIINDLVNEVKANKDINAALKNFIRKYQPGSANFDRAIRAIAKTDILPSILAHGADIAASDDRLAPILNIIEKADGFPCIQNDRIRKLYDEAREFGYNAIRKNPKLYSQLRSVMDGSSAYKLASADFFRKLLPKNLNESERACADILLNYYAYIAAGGNTADLPESYVKTIKEAFAHLTRGRNPFGLSVEGIMSMVKQAFPWMADLSWLLKPVTP